MHGQPFCKQAIEPYSTSIELFCSNSTLLSTITPCNLTLTSLRAIRYTGILFRYIKVAYLVF